MFTKGAPDVLLDRCDREWVCGEVVDLTDDRRQAILDTVDRLADEIRAVEPRFTGRIERAIVDPITQAVTLTVAEEI